MARKSIKQKPELIVAGVLIALMVLPLLASAADAISTHAIGNYLTNEMMYIFKLAVGLVFLAGLVMIGIGALHTNPNLKSKGFVAVGAVVIIVLLYYLVPGILAEMGKLAKPTSTFGFGGGSANNSSSFGGGW